MNRPLGQRRRTAVRLLLAGAAVGLVVAVWGLHQTLAVGIGHKAKVLCSGVFVSGRTLDAVEQELQADDLAVLRYVGAKLDRQRGSVTASALGLVTREAVYREGLGCTLVLDGLAPPRLSRQATPAANGVWSDPAASDVHERGRLLNGAVARAFDESDPLRPRRTAAVVVVHQGRIVAERYAPGVGAETPLPGWSMSKSVMNALVGVLVREGRLALDAPAGVPEWQRPGDRRAAITLDLLLRMSSGLRFDEGMSSARSDVMQMLFGVGDASAFAVDRLLAAEPGHAWEYSSATSNILARLVRQQLADDEAYLSFPRRALFDPLGMTTAVMETDAAGTFIGSSYTYASARDWARFGMLYLQDGVWNGIRILPDGWIAYTSSPAPADPTRRYGAHFWLEVPEEYGGRDPRLPVPALHAAGHEGQFVTIVPSHSAVIVRLGRTRYPGAWDHATFIRDVLAALDADSVRAHQR